MTIGGLIKMKVLGIIGAARKNGTVSSLTKKVLEGTQENGNLTELINLYDYDIQHCKGCWSCHTGKCTIDDDFEKVFIKIKEADIIILGSPVYWANISGIMKTFFDRHTVHMHNRFPDGRDLWKLPTREKIKKGRNALKKFGPMDREDFKKKQYILIVASTVPFKHIFGGRKEVVPTINALKRYINKLQGKLIGKLIYTDTLFRFFKKKRDKMMNKAFRLGKSLKKTP